MVVMIGSACIDEHGKAHGGEAGNQSGKELKVQPWYRHSLGWVVIRAKSPAVRARIAAAMRLACANKQIGYDQYQRDTLYNAAKAHGFDPSLVTVACETDCSALVRVCLAYAGITVGNIHTVNEPAVLKATGQFDLLTDAFFTDHPDRLKTGDILCTPVSGHTVIVLNDGSISVPETVQKGDKGDTVKRMQLLLQQHGAPTLAADGDFGPKTDAAIRAFQKAHGLTVDGIVGPKTWAELLK